MDDLDFIELEKRRSVSDLEITEKGNNVFQKNANTIVDMRINKITHNHDKVAEIVLIFRLQYFPLDLPDLYQIFLTYKIKILDKNLVLKNRLNSELSISYMATHFKESAERLYIELRDKSRKLFNRDLIGEYEITHEVAYKQCEIILNQYNK